MDSTTVLMEKLWLGLGTAPQLLQQPKLPSEVSKAIVSFSTTMGRNTNTGKPGLGR